MRSEWKGRRIKAAIEDGLALWCAGNNGQCDGAVNAAVRESSPADCDAIDEDMAQWCAPWRRQHAGRDASSSWPKARASGPSPKARASTMERTRRIWESCYMNLGVIGDSGLSADSGIIDASRFPDT